jgi:hypothetical protein
MKKMRTITALLAAGIGLLVLATPALSRHGGPMMGAGPGMGAPHIHMYSAPIGRPRVYAWQGHAHSNFRHFRHGRRVFFAAGYPYDDDDYDYGYGGCGWLYRRAIATGSSYWWHRYRACLY